MAYGTSERSRLLPDVSTPRYVFESSIGRERHRRIQQFQCCLCVIFMKRVRGILSYIFRIRTMRRISGQRAIFHVVINFFWFLRCFTILFIIVVVSFAIGTSFNYPNDTITNNDTTTDVPLSNSFIVLMANNWPIPDQNDTQTIHEQDLTKWEEATQAGRKALEHRDEIEKNLTKMPYDSPSYRHQKTVATSSKARNMSRIGYEEEYALKHYAENGGIMLRKNVKICGDKCRGDLSVTSCSGTAKYRSYNGSCNNLNFPQEYGVAYTAFRRALPPDYADGISQPRKSKNGTQLPSARTVSLVVHRPYFKDDAKFSVVLAVWGQFLDHDMTATALSQGPNGTPITCCNTNFTHPECFPVLLDAFDPYVRYNLSCMEFVRSAPAPKCCLSPRQQINQVSAYIDGSVVYSADEELVLKLRTMTGGELEMFVTEDNRTLLPVSKDSADGCNRKDENANGKYCFLAGDARSNENLHLTSMHLIWARNHNLLAQRLKFLNPHWNDERLFQEARKILGAQMQHITYKEFLPILLGPEVMTKFDLNPQSEGEYFTGYNDTIDASIANSFAAAAFRFAHSIIPGLMKLLANDTSSPEFLQLHKMLFDPYKLYVSGELDRTLRGAMDTTIEASDPYFTDELKQHLFENNNNKTSMNQLCGLDLVSLNIQRGRDHGLPAYNHWRNHCGLSNLENFQDFQDTDQDILQNIQSIYRDISDVDLYTGALSEKPINGSILGPTLTCLILDQFVRTKYGDRFWYENPGVFTLEQLDQIRKTSLGKVICDNADDVDQVQPLVMEKVREDNQMVACSELPGPDLGPWKETLAHVMVPSEVTIVKAASVNG